MNFPRHWSFAKSGRGQAWGWSDVSLAAAQAAARERAAKVDAVLRGSSRPDRAAEYYPGQPMREPVLRELAGPDGGLAAVVTRNTYGADILNAADALFVDVDLPEPAQPGLLARLFGAKAPPPGQPLEGAGTSAYFNSPRGLALWGETLLVVAEYASHRVRAVPVLGVTS